VRFRDCDPLGHVNNAVYLTYLEQARFSYWRQVWGFGNPSLAKKAGEAGGTHGAPASERRGAQKSPRATEPGWEGQPDPNDDVPGVILARVECDYKRPATPGELLDVRLSVGEVGRSSFRFDYEIVDEQGRTVALAKTVLVMYDYAAGKPVSIPDRIRALLTA
jgi:acyl-CoA thioester hydrolase